MAQFTIKEHLASMLQTSPEAWLIDLATMLQELGDIDSALAASRAYDLSRNHEAAHGLKDLLQGYHTIQQELAENNLTLNQRHTVQTTLHALGQTIMKLAQQQGIKAIKPNPTNKEKRDHDQ
jgi:hypothetical protein